MHVPFRTQVLAKLLSFHGLALVVFWPAATSPEPIGAAVVSGVSLLLFSLWVMEWPASTQKDWFAFGVLPGAWITAEAVIELGGGTYDASFVLLSVTGVVAHMVAASILGQSELDGHGLTLQPANKSASTAPRLRAQGRTALLAFIAITFVASIVFINADAEHVAPPARAFAAVMSSVLGASVLLLLVPAAMRRQAPIAMTTSGRVGRASAALLVAIAVMILERVTR